MYRSDDKDYENLVLERNDLEAREVERGLERNERSMKQDDGKYGSDFDTSRISTDTKHVSSSDRDKSMVKSPDGGEKRGSRGVEVDPSPPDDVKSEDSEESERPEESEEDETGQIESPCRDTGDYAYKDEKPKSDMIDKEIIKKEFYKRKGVDIDRDDNKDLESVGDRTYENGDRNNNLVEQNNDEEKLRTIADWLENARTIDEADTRVDQGPNLDQKLETATVVSGVIYSSGVEGSSERSDSDESQMNLPEHLSKYKVKVLPSMTKRYKSLSRKSGTSDSFSEKESESISAAFGTEGRSIGELLMTTMVCKDHHKHGKERKRALIKMLPIIKQDSSSDSTSVEGVLPLSDMSDRRVRRIRRERRWSSEATLEEPKAEHDESTSEVMTSSDSTVANMADRSIKKDISDDKCLSDSQDMPTDGVSKSSSMRTLTPIRQASYKIAMKHSDYSELSLEKYPSESAVTSSENIITQIEMEAKIKAKSKKPFLRKISYEMAVAGGLISVSPSPKASLAGSDGSLSSYKSHKDIESPSTSKSVTHDDKAEDIPPVDEGKRNIQKQRSKSMTINKEASTQQFSTSSAPLSRSTTSESDSNEKMLSLGEAISRLRKLPPDHADNMSWDSDRCSSKTSLESLPSTTSYISRRSTDSSIADLQTVKDNPLNTSLVPWNAFADGMPESNSQYVSSNSLEQTITDETATDKSPRKIVIPVVPGYTCPHDEMMNIMLSAKVSYINNSIISKIKTGSVRKSSRSYRKIHLDGEVILLENDLPLCNDCNVISVQILWARQIIARLNDAHVYANIPPYSENLAVIRRIISKATEDSDEETEMADRSFYSPLDLNTIKGFKIKRGLIRKKSSRRNVRKFVKGAIEVIPELEEDVDEESSRGSHERKNASKAKDNGFRVKGYKRRSLTRKAYTHDMKQMKKQRRQIAEKRLKRDKQSQSSSDAESLVKRKARKARCKRKSPRSSESDTNVADDESNSDWSLCSSVSCSCPGSPDEIDKKKGKKNTKPWWKKWHIKKTEVVKPPLANFPVHPLSMNIIQHDDGRLEVMYGKEEEYPYAVGEYSNDDGRYLTMEEIFLKRYRCYRPPEDYFFNVRGQTSNLTVIKMFKRTKFVRVAPTRNKYYPPTYVFRSTNDPGECPKREKVKKRKSAKQILQQLFTRSAQKDKDGVEDQLSKRGVSLPCLPPRRPVWKTAEILDSDDTPPKIGPKPERYRQGLIRKETSLDDEIETKEDRTPDLPQNVQYLPPGMYFYPYSDDNSTPTYFLKITLTDRSPPIFTFHCVKGHTTLKYLINKYIPSTIHALHPKARWADPIFKLRQKSNGIHVDIFNLATCPPVLMKKEFVSDCQDSDSITYKSSESSSETVPEANNKVKSPQSPVKSPPHSDDVSTVLQDSEKPPVYVAFKFPALRDSITHKPVVRRKLKEDEYPNYFVYGRSTQSDEAYQYQYRNETDTAGIRKRSPIPKKKVIIEDEKTVLARQLKVLAMGEFFPILEEFEINETQSDLPLNINTHVHSPVDKNPILSPKLVERYSTDTSHSPALSPVPIDHARTPCYPNTSAHSPSQLSSKIPDHNETSVVIEQFKIEPIPSPPKSTSIYEYLEIQETIDEHTKAIEYVQPSPSPLFEDLNVAETCYSLEESLPDWYLPRLYRPSTTIPESAEKTTEIPDNKTSKKPNISMIKEKKRLIESYKYPWEYCHAKQRLLIQDRVTNRRRSAGDARTENLPLQKTDTVSRTNEERQTREGFLEDVRRRLESDSQLYAMPLASPTPMTSAERQLRSPSYYSLSHYPATEAMAAVYSSRHEDRTYSEREYGPQVYPHTSSGNASRHSIRTSSRDQLSTMVHHPLVYLKPAMRSIGTYYDKPPEDPTAVTRLRLNSCSSDEYDPQSEPVKPSRAAELQDYHHPTCRFSMSRLRASLDAPQLIFRRTTEPEINANYQNQDRFISRSSGFLNDPNIRLELYDTATGRRGIYVKKANERKYFSHSADHIAERMAHHYLVQSGTQTGVSKEQSIEKSPVTPKKKQGQYLKKPPGHYISHSNEDIANRIAFHFTGDASEMTHITESSSLGLPSKYKKTPPAPFVWFSLKSKQVPERPKPERKNSPIWAKPARTRNKTV